MYSVTHLYFIVTDISCSGDNMKKVKIIIIREAGFTRPRHTLSYTKHGKY